MPWRPEDAPLHNNKADTPHLCRMWNEVANKALAETGNEGHAIRAANAAVAKARRRARVIGDFQRRSITQALLRRP